jgi:hypothetical protein
MNRRKFLKYLAAAPFCLTLKPQINKYIMGADLSKNGDYSCLVAVPFPVDFKLNHYELIAQPDWSSIKIRSYLSKIRTVGSNA